MNWALFSGELIFREASKWIGLNNKNSLKYEDNSLKQLITVNCNSPSAYIWEGLAYIEEDLLSDGYSLLKFGGLIFGKAHFWTKTCFPLIWFAVVLPQISQTPSSFQTNFTWRFNKLVFHCNYKLVRHLPSWTLVICEWVYTIQHTFTWHTL